MKKLLQIGNLLVKLEYTFSFVKIKTYYYHQCWHFIFVNVWRRSEDRNNKSSVNVHVLLSIAILKFRKIHRKSPLMLYVVDLQYWPVKKTPSLVFAKSLKLTSAVFFFCFFTKNCEKYFSFHLKSSFYSRDIQMFVIFSLPFHTFQIQKDVWNWNNLWCNGLACIN